MLLYVLKRLALSLPLLLGVSLVTFVLVYFSPSDPAEVALRVNDIVPTVQAVEEMRAELGLDKPFYLRYGHWLLGVVQGDFGKSYVTGRLVFDEILHALPATLALAGAALAMGLVLSLSIGIWCALHEESLGDKVLRGGVFMLSAMPSFWLGLGLMWLFALHWDLLPSSGMEEPKSILLPALTLALVYTPTYTRLIRNTMVQTLNAPFVLYAKARGLQPWRIARHVFKNSLHLSITALGMSIPKLLAGTVVIESIFAWPGVGRLCISAIFNRDYPMIQSYVLMMAALFVLFNLLSDLVNALIDPRLKKAL